MDSVGQLFRGNSVLDRFNLDGGAVFVGARDRDNLLPSKPQVPRVDVGAQKVDEGSKVGNRIHVRPSSVNYPASQ